MNKKERSKNEAPFTKDELNQVLSHYYPPTFSLVSELVKSFETIVEARNPVVVVELFFPIHGPNGPVFKVVVKKHLTNRLLRPMTGEDTQTAMEWRNGGAYLARSVLDFPLNAADLMKLGLTTIPIVAPLPVISGSMVSYTLQIEQTTGVIQYEVLPYLQAATRNELDPLQDESFVFFQSAYTLALFHTLVRKVEPLVLRPQLSTQLLLRRAKKSIEAMNGRVEKLLKGSTQGVKIRNLMLMVASTHKYRLELEREFMDLLERSPVMWQHLDPHPGNMLLAADGQLYLLDFGDASPFVVGIDVLLAALQHADPAEGITAYMAAVNQEKYTLYLTSYFRALKKIEQDLYAAPLFPEDFSEENIRLLLLIIVGYFWQSFLIPDYLGDQKLRHLIPDSPSLIRYMKKEEFDEMVGIAWQAYLSSEYHQR